MKKLNKKGFTLIELIVVIAILAILAAILVPAIINYVSQAGDSRDQANARSIYSEVSIELATTEATTITLPTDFPDSCEVFETSDTTATAATTLTPADLETFVVKCGNYVFDGREMATD